MINPHKTYWVKVSPVEWIYDNKSNLLISKYGLAYGNIRRIVGFAKVCT